MIPALATTFLVAIQLAAATTCYEPLAFYRSLSNVTQHARIDLDIKEIDTLADSEATFADAVALYTNGKNSAKSTSLRKLKDFSIQAPALMAGQPYYEMYKAYWDSGTYANDMVQAAGDSTGDFAGTSLVTRSENFVKGIQYQVVWMYVIREMEDAIDDCEVANATRNDNNVLAWDEAWAFYAGSLVKANGTGSGSSLWTLAQKRCDAFAQCGSDGIAKVNKDVYALFAQGQAMLQLGQCSEAAAVIKKIVAKMTIPLIQGALRYAHRGTTNAGWTGTLSNFQKERAEGWAFFAAFLPQINACSPTIAAKVKDNIFFKATTYMADGEANIVRDIQSTYSCMGLSCAEIGELKEGSTVIYPQCTESQVQGSMAHRVSSGNIMVFVTVFGLWMSG